MLNGIKFKELATEKTLTIEPTSTGMMFFFHNHALEERMHIVLNEEDLKLLVPLLQLKLNELEEGK